MNRSVCVLILIILCTAKFATAQQDASFSQYMFVTQYYNPAFAGVEGITKFTALHRTQWLGYRSAFDGAGGNPHTQTLQFTTPVFRANSGVGVHLVNDNLGGLNNVEAQVAYAYHLDIRGNKLSVGLRGGLFSQTIDFDRYRLVHPNDPVVGQGRESQVRPDLAAGVYYRAEKYYVGVSVNHLVQAEFDWGSDAMRNPLQRHVFFTAGYDYEMNYNFVITPSVLMISDFNQYSFDVNLMGTYNDKIWGGLSYRRSEALIMMFGYSLFKDNSLRFGYGFDFVVQGRDAKTATSHEVLLSYVLPAASAGGKKIIRTPRFRH